SGLAWIWWEASRRRSRRASTSCLIRSLMVPRSVAVIAPTVAGPRELRARRHPRSGVVCPRIPGMDNARFCVGASAVEQHQLAELRSGAQALERRGVFVEAEGAVDRDRQSLLDHAGDLGELSVAAHCGADDLDLLEEELGQVDLDGL